MGAESFPGGKAAGAWLWQPTPSIAEVKERVDTYLYSASGPLCPVLGWTLPCNVSVYQLCFCSHFRSHVGLSEFLQQLSGQQKELTEICETERDMQRQGAMLKSWYFVCGSLCAWWSNHSEPILKLDMQLCFCTTMRVKTVDTDCTRWFKYDRDWFVCQQAALRSSCATLREW